MNKFVRSLFLSLVPPGARVCGVALSPLWTIPTYFSFVCRIVIVFTIPGLGSSYVYCTVKSSQISFESVYWSRTVFVQSPIPIEQWGMRDDVGLGRTPTSSKHLVLMSTDSY
jgi:hypothetical protein